MKWVGLAVLSLLVIGIAVNLVSRTLNSRVIRDLRENPEGERALRVMVLTLPSGKVIPVNYLREGPYVYAAADFPWWRQLRGAGGRVTVLIRGETHRGHARALPGDSRLRTRIFEQLRPTAPRWTGTLVEIELEADSAALRPGDRRAEPGDKAEFTPDR